MTIGERREVHVKLVPKLGGKILDIFCASLGAQQSAKPFCDPTEKRKHTTTD